MTSIVIDYPFYWLDTPGIGQSETRYFVEYSINDFYDLWTATKLIVSTHQ